MSRQQVNRIEKMEKALNESKMAIEALKSAMDGYEAAQKAFYELEDYYGSTRWMQDYEDDEAGKLPPDIPRGVLSEDAVYNLLTEHRELMTRLQKAVLKSMEENLF